MSQKALASNIDGSELPISEPAKHQKYPLSGKIARLGAEGHVTRVKEFSMRLETPAGKKPF